MVNRTGPLRRIAAASPQSSSPTGKPVGVEGPRLAYSSRSVSFASAARFLRERFRELHERYQRLLFDKDTRAEYLEKLGIRVARAAERLSLTDRVRSCV